MRRWLKARPIGLALVSVVVAALGLSPPFDGLSYELALAVGLLGPSVAAVVTALELSGRQAGGFSMLARAVENGLAVAAVAYAVAFLHGLRVGFCDLLDGTLLFALGPAIGCVLGAVWGAAVSELSRRFRRRRMASVLFASAGPLGSALFQLSIFYATPSIFAFDPFVGYFSGALFDTVLGDSGLSSYRVGSAATLLAVYVASLHLERVAGRLRYRSLGRPGLLALGAACALASLLSVLFGSRLGHWHSASSIREELGATLVSGRCELVYDRRIDGERASRLARDCDAHVEAVEAWLGAPTVDRVTAYVFHDRDQKRALMGAAGTSVAKPWRREIYLNDEGYPHPVVGHELVHALAAPFGRGPFDIAGAFGGLLPNPGLIEGVAVAGSPHDDTLDVHAWAATMRAIEVLPRLEGLFSLSFFLNASATSYTAAGSFVSHVHDSYGAEVVRAWYGGADLPELTGKGWPQLEQDWWEMLDAIAVDEAAIATARRRFDRPSILMRRCPHEVDEALHEGKRALDGGDLVGAEDFYRLVLELDPSSSHARFGLARAFDRRGEIEAARAVLERLAADEDLTQATRDQATEQLGDLALRGGEIDRARDFYEAAKERVIAEGRRRTLDLFYHYADVPVARQALLALLVGTTRRGPSQPEALDLFGRWRMMQPEDGTPAYLMARQYLSEHRYALATAALHEALGKELPVERVRLEALRLLVVSSCAQGQPGQAARALAKYREHPLAKESRVAYVERLVERCSRP